MAKRKYTKNKKNIEEPYISSMIYRPILDLKKSFWDQMELVEEMTLSFGRPPSGGITIKPRQIAEDLSNRLGESFDRSFEKYPLVYYKMPSDFTELRMICQQFSIDYENILETIIKEGAQLCFKD